MTHVAHIGPFGRSRHTAMPPRQRATDVAGHLGGPGLVLASSASLQTSAALATTAFPVYGTAGTGALRFAFAAPVLLLVARPHLRGRAPGFWLAATALGGVLVALNLALYEALARLPLGSVVTLQFLGPLALALATVRRRLDLLWIAAAAVGVVLITGGPSGGSTAGVAFAMGAAGLTMLTLLLSRRLATQSAGLDGLAVAVAVAACITLPVAVPAAAATDAARQLGLVAAVAMLGVAVPYALEYVALRAVSIRAFSVLLSLDPAIAALAGAVWLAQRMTGAETLGIALVVLASAGVMASRARPR